MESFQHLNLDERLSIEYGLALDKSIRQIAKIIKIAFVLFFTLLYILFIKNLDDACRLVCIKQVYNHFQSLKKFRVW